MSTITTAKTQITHVTRTVEGNYHGITSTIERLLGRYDGHRLAQLKLAKDHQNSKEVVEKWQQLVASCQGELELMIMLVFDHGEALRLSGKATSVQAKQYIFGNPLFAVKMTGYDIRSALYAPLRMVVFQNPNEPVKVEYDSPSDLFGQFHNADVSVTADLLTSKVEKLIDIVEATVTAKKQENSSL